jgi:uncharacterized protein YjbI with pentapeptide repeats
MTWFSANKPLPKFQIKNLSGEVIFERPWADLYGRDLSGPVLHNADVRNVRIDYCDCRGTDFTGSKFNNSSMRGCDLRGAIVQYCDFSGADLSECQIDGADFLYSEFGRPRRRCKMDGVAGLNQAVISKDELCNGQFEDGKHVLKFRRTKPRSKKELALIPERPRALLVLGEIGFQGAKYEGWDDRTKPSWKRRTQRPERGGLC